MLPTLFVITISYLIGSIPTAYIFGSLLKGIDIRKHGSGNVGATNALRVLGKGPGILVLLLDVLKGALPLLLLGNALLKREPGLDPELTRVLIGIGCICGHNWTVFLQFKGGKGIATTLGVLIGLAVAISGLRIVLTFELLTWLVIFLSLRIVSIASVCAGIMLPAYMILFRQSPLLVGTSVLLAAFVILRHKANLKRFTQGKEPRISFTKKQ